MIEVCSLTVLAGCVDNKTTITDGRLSLGGDTYLENGTWYIDLYLDHINGMDSDFHTITVYGYSEDGDVVFERVVGDSTGSVGIREEMTIKCDGFPYLITTTADETPCEEGLTFEIIRWAGSDKQKTETIEGSVLVWEEFERQCDEDLPPTRLLPDAKNSSSDSDS